MVAFLIKKWYNIKNLMRGFKVKKKNRKERTKQIVCLILVAIMVLSTIVGGIAGFMM
jgi:hypothetical protein